MLAEGDALHVGQRLARLVGSDGVDEHEAGVGVGLRHLDHRVGDEEADADRHRRPRVDRLLQVRHVLRLLGRLQRLRLAAELVGGPV